MGSGVRGTRNFTTRMIHAGESPDRSTGARGVPIHLSATYAFGSYNDVRDWEDGLLPHHQYSRESNPTVAILEAKISDLEGGEATIATASGMAAISALLLHFGGDRGHIVAGSELFGPTGDFLENELLSLGVDVTRVDARDLAAVEAAIKPETRLILVETLTNPKVEVADVPALAELAHRHGALLAVDNTFLSPSLYRPLEDGADLVLHSATKYLSGHGQTIGGLLTGSEYHIAAIKQSVTRLGSYMPAFNAWLLILGCKTLAFRVERHSATAQRLAEHLASHPVVGSVHYPGLPGDPGHATLLKLNGGLGGGLLSFQLKGDPDTTRAFIDALELCTVAVSLGEPMTLIWPYRDGLIRLAVGLEDPDDLIADLESGLEAASAVLATAAAAT